jgi:hypothetical protein
VTKSVFRFCHRRKLPPPNSTIPDNHRSSGKNVGKNVGKNEGKNLASGIVLFRGG